MVRKAKIKFLTKKDLREEKLNEIIVSFSLAMQRADRSFIATRGKMTPSMEIAWELYREWCEQEVEEAA